VTTDQISVTNCWSQFNFYACDATWWGLPVV